MEAVGALAGSRPATLLESAREVARARSRTFWIVVGISGLAVALRFATLGLQAYHHDEIVTASRVLGGGFAHVMDAVGFSESAPPLYYALAWLWTQLTGTGEFGLRSLSALAGVATVPVAYLLGAELSPRSRLAVPSPGYMGEGNSGASGAGLVAAALVAVNPMLLWYSQEARAYALLVLLTSLSLLYFLRALHGAREGGPAGACRLFNAHMGTRETARGRGATLWGVFSALALATHYFALFPVALEALWLLWRRGRESLRGQAIVVAGGLLLAPLAVHQMLAGRADWIGNDPLTQRLGEMAVAFATGETGNIVAAPGAPLPALLPIAAALAALALLAARGERRELRAGAPVLAIAAGTVAVPVLLALAGKDYVLARNLLPALVPLLVAVAVGTTLRRARRAGAALAALLIAYSLGFSVWASLAPGLQRPDWETVADRLGEPSAPRAIVAWTLGAAPLRHYLSTGPFQAAPADGYSWYAHEVFLVSDGPAPRPPERLLGPRFVEVSHESLGRLRVRRYALPGPDLAPLRLWPLQDAELNWRTNRVLLDGMGAP